MAATTCRFRTRSSARDAGGALLATLSFDGVPSDDVDVLGHPPYGRRHPAPRPRVRHLRQRGDRRRLLHRDRGLQHHDLERRDVAPRRPQDVPAGRAAGATSLPAFSGARAPRPSARSRSARSRWARSRWARSRSARSRWARSRWARSRSAIPVGSIPVGSIGVGSIPVGSIPVGSISLSSVLLAAAGELGAHSPGHAAGRSAAAGIDAQGRLRQPDGKARLTLTLAQSGLSQSILSGVPLSAILLGGATLGQLPPPGGATDWCAAVTAAGGGTPQRRQREHRPRPRDHRCPGRLDPGPARSRSARSEHSGRLHPGGVDPGRAMTSTRRDGQHPGREHRQPGRRPDVHDELPGDARRGQGAGFLRPGATLAQLLGVDADGSLGNLGNLILNDILLGILRAPRSTGAASSTASSSSEAPARTPHYHVRVNVPCNGAPGFNVNVLLPKGFIVKPQTSFVTYADRRPARRAQPDDERHDRSALGQLGARPLRGALLGLADGPARLRGPHRVQLNTQTAVATAGFGGTTLQDNAQIVVTQNWERNEDPATAPVVGPTPCRSSTSPRPATRRSFGCRSRRCRVRGRRST